MFPPTFDDLLHHGGWIMLTYVTYRSPITTQEPNIVLTMRVIGVVSFFSLGLNNLTLLGNFLMHNLGDISRPPKWMCLSYTVSTWIMCFSRPVEWTFYVTTVASLCEAAHSLQSRIIWASACMVMAGICNLHRKWAQKCLRNSRTLWENFAEQTLASRSSDTTSKSKERSLSRTVFRSASLVVDGYSLMAITGLALPHIARSL